MNEPQSQPWNGPETTLSQLSASGWLKSIRWYETLDSTNNVCKQYAMDDEKVCPVLVVAREQTAGRGRRGRSWHSDSGSLTFSILLRGSDVHSDRTGWPQLALVAGLAVRDALAGLSDEVVLKWPNDVYLSGRKVAGVLIETAGANSQFIVVGVGINIRTDFSQAPTEVRQRAVSANMLSDQELETFSLLPDVIERFQSRLSQWILDRSVLAMDFKQYCLLTGCDVTVQDGGQQVSGRCLGIDSEGRLQLELSDHRQKFLSSGEVVQWTMPT